MQKSDQIDELAKALCKAQSKLKHAVKDSTNPHFKSKYADLASVINACKDELTANGLSVAQGLSSADGTSLTCTTMLLHTSGQWLSSDLTLRPTKQDAQGIGSCATYARRYSLAAMVGIAQDDDDGQAAVQKPAPEYVAPVPTKKPSIFEGTEAQCKVIQDLCFKKGMTDEQYGEVCTKLMGKPSTELMKIVAEVIGYEPNND